MTPLLPAVLLLLLLVLQWTRALDRLPAPVNVVMDSVDFRHELKWDPGPGTPPGTHYKVFVRNNGRSNQKSSNTTHCVLRLKNFHSSYIFTVQAVYNQSLVSSESAERTFYPSKQTKISEPGLSLVGGDHRLELNISLPKMHRAAKIPDIQKFYDFKYNIEWKPAGGGRSMSIDTTNSSVVLDKLKAGMEYCVQVRMINRLNVAPTLPGRWVCAWTSVPEPNHVPTIIGIMVPVIVVVVLAVVGLSLVLHYTGILCDIEARLPASLLVSFVDSYLLMPETTISARVYLRPEADKQKRRKPHPQSAVQGPRLKDVDEDEYEEDEDKGQSGYMNRAGELSSDSDSQDAHRDFSGSLRDVARPTVDSGEVLVVESPLPVSHGQPEVRGPSVEWPVMLDGAQHETVGIAMSRCERDVVRVSVDAMQAERGEEECHVNLLSVTLAKGYSENVNLCSAIFGKKRETADNEPDVEYDPCGRGREPHRTLGSAAVQSAMPSDTLVVPLPAFLDQGGQRGDTGCEARRSSEGLATSCSSLLSHGGETDNEEEREEFSGYLDRC